MEEVKKKSKWKSEWNKNRTKNQQVMSFRVEEDEAMWIYGNASNEGCSVSEYIRKIVLADYYKNLPEKKDGENG